LTGLVFDLGGTHLRAAVAAADGALSDVRKQRLVTVADGIDSAEVWNQIRQSLASYIHANLHATPAGSPLVLSFPGPIDRAGRALQAPTLTGGEPEIPDLRSELETLSGRPVHLLNDLSAAAWYLSGSCRGRFLVVTVSSGIGAKLFDPLIGVLDEVPYAGEIGHTVAEPGPDAPRCDCGGRGHLGALASGRGIERRARQEARARPERFARSACARRYGATPATLNNEDHLVPALRDGDRWATEIVAASCTPLARSLVDSIVVAGLASVVVIGGFALAAGEAYLALLRRAAQLACDYDLLSHGIAERFTLGALGEEACLLGADVYGRRVMSETVRQ
jgi:glucokinase